MGDPPPTAKELVKLLPSLDGLGKHVMEKTFSDQSTRDAALEKALTKKVVFNETKSDSRTQTSDLPSGK